ncbi:phosphopyruvate hydratase [Psychromonas sp. MME2]|uniref:phosphopyruvate hydratase n=1 Tax=unclassified Psychromonas TaxID=2614957 RepID=UPI00339BEBDE
MNIIVEVLGWTSVAFYILLLLFNGMKNMRLASFLSVANDVVWGFMIGVMPKVLLNLVVGSVTFYRYICDFTNTPKKVTYILLALMILGIGYFTHFAINDYLANPSLGLLLTWVDFALILIALSVKRLRIFQLFMLTSAFVGGFAYYLLGIEQMVVIKAIVGGITSYKLFIHPFFPQLESKLLFWKSKKSGA